MCKCTPAPESGTPSIAPPGAWYDLSARLTNARAVASCIADSLPTLDGMNYSQRESINHAAGLAGALDDVLDLCERDVERLELELKGSSSC